MNHLLLAPLRRSGIKDVSLRQARLASTVTGLSDPQGSRTRGRRRQLFSEKLSRPAGGAYPRLDHAHPILDAWSTGEVAPASSGGAKNLFDQPPAVTYYNETPPFPLRSSKDRDELKPRVEIPKNQQHTYVLLRKRVVHQTGKGKIASMYYGVVVGNGNGIVGFGDAKSDDQQLAVGKATNNALKNCDAVELFEGRTIWTDMRIKFGSTELHLRPRPRGFGLMCNPNVHQVCKAAGIKDISAKVHGSRNPMAIIKATLMLLHSGGAPLGMGDGIGGRGRREEKKQGIKSQAVMERERGRAFMEGGSWI